jgi:hypothetical protein
VSLNVPLELYVDLQVLARFKGITVMEVIVKATAPLAAGLCEEVDESLRKLVALQNDLECPPTGNQRIPSSFAIAAQMCPLRLPLQSYGVVDVHS